MKHLEKACESSIKAAREELHRKISVSQKQVVKAYCEAWKKRFPKRKLKLVAGMGTMFFLVDDEVLHIDYNLIITKEQGSTGLCKDYPTASYEGWKHYGITLDRNYYSQFIFKELIQAYHFVNETLENDEYIDTYLQDMEF